MDTIKCSRCGNVMVKKQEMIQNFGLAVVLSIIGVGILLAARSSGASSNLQFVVLAFMAWPLTGCQHPANVYKCNACQKTEKI